MSALLLIKKNKNQVGFLKWERWFVTSLKKWSGKEESNSDFSLGSKGREQSPEQWG